MNRLLSILVTLFILFLVYLWINHLMGSSDTKTVPEPVATSVPEQPENPPSDYHIRDDDTPDINSDTTASQTVTSSDEKTEEPIVQETETPKKTETKPVAPEKPASPPPAPANPAPQPVKTVEKDAGVHLVIAGNFLERANAEERVRELKKLGYAKAEVVNFELSEYHTACAGRYTDINEARRVAKKIKDQHGIDTYVRHGN